jgi:undecaprenyl-diphosphatase
MIGWAGVASGTVLFICSALAVRLGATAWDVRLYRLFNEVPTWASSVLTPFSRLFSPIGIGIVVVLIGISAGFRNRTLFPIVVAAGSAGAAWLFANLAKAVAERPRPYDVVADAVLRQDPARGTSFPSSHTAIALGVAIALVPFLARPIGAMAIAYAVLVGWSRMYLGVHYPLDVLGGAGIGIATGSATLLIAGRLFHQAAAGRSGSAPRPDS